MGNISELPFCFLLLNLLGSKLTHRAYGSPFSLDAISDSFLSGLGLTIWSEINYAVLHIAKELQGFCITVFASEHIAVSSSSKSREQQAHINSVVFVNGLWIFVGYCLV